MAHRANIWLETIELEVLDLADGLIQGLEASTRQMDLALSVSSGVSRCTGTQKLCLAGLKLESLLSGIDQMRKCKVRYFAMLLVAESTGAPGRRIATAGYICLVQICDTKG